MFNPPPSLADALADAVSRTGAAAPLVLFFASFVEYVFPPAPGDLLVIVGSWYAVHGAISWPATFAVTTAGALAGAALDYRVGVTIGRSLDRRAAAKGGLSAERLAWFEAGYRRFGAWLLVANRFLPGIRAFFFVAAGASGIPLRRVLLLGGLSAALWNALLLGAGALAARNLADLVLLFDRYTRAAWIVVALAAALAAVAVLFARRAARARGAGGR